jgi:hypothetical protein
MGESIIGQVPSVDNPAHICTKVMPGGKTWNHFIRLLLHDLCDCIFLHASMGSPTDSSINHTKVTNDLNIACTTFSSNSFPRHY